MTNNLPPNYQPIVFSEQIFSCRLAANVNLSGNLSPANNVNGLGTTLTNNTTLAALSIDSVIPKIGDRILLVAQTAAAQNGVWVVTVVGDSATAWVLARAPDWCNVEQMQAGQYVSIEDGAALSGSIYVFIRTLPNIINVDNIIFKSVSSASGGTVNPGLTGQVAYYPADGNVIDGTNSLPGQVQVSVDSLNSGVNANGTHFWRGDGIWAVITGSDIFIWNEVTTTSQAAVVDNGYVTNNAALVTVTLPAVAAFGKIVAVQGKGAGGWSCVANTGQTIHVGNAASGVAGSVSSTDRYDAMELICITANTTWSARSVIGNLTIA